MRLQSAHITKYKSINDSTRFSLEGDITALWARTSPGRLLLWRRSTGNPEQLSRSVDR